ncbi:MAG: hypothetical protein PVI86_13460 [Phycisphaerae bacterium]|jgi:hypothetical protein
MPKTFTSDAGLLLPSAIQGPLQVIDPTDDSSWIRIDPANARLSAAGEAKPTRVVSSPHVRTYGSTSSTYIANTITARAVNASSFGGIYFAPFQIPLDMDVSKTSNVSILVSPGSDATTNGQAVRFTLDWGTVTPGGGATTGANTYDWNVPDDWTDQDSAQVTIDTGGGYTFAACTFENGDHAAVRVIRSGFASEDTFDKTLKIAEQVLFEYTSTEI